MGDRHKGREKEAKVCFFEKKKQKTFGRWAASYRPRFSHYQSFFASFCSQKEDLTYSF